MSETMNGVSEPHREYEVGDRITMPGGQIATVVGKIPDRPSVHWFGEAVPRELRVGDHWNGALIVELGEDFVVGELSMRIPSSDDDDQPRKSSGETPT